MYKVCSDCRKSYIEQDEEICLDCSIYVSDENEYIHQSMDESILDNINEEELNDMDVSISEQKY